MKKSSKKTAGKQKKTTKKVVAETKTPDPKREKREFTVTTAAGDKVRVEYDPFFRHQMSYHGPISETGFRSDFSFDGNGDPEAHAKKMADAFQAEMTKQKAKGARKSKPKADASSETSAEQPAPAPTAEEPRKKTARKDGAMSGLDAAAKVLAESGEPMGCKAIVESALEKGYWKTGGKTPAASVYAAIIREIAKKGKDARFRKTGKGMFAIKA